MELRKCLMVVAALLMAAAGLFFLPRVGLADKPVKCTDLLLPGGQCAADVGAAVAACCDCNGFRNHGQYVSCVARASNELRKAGCLDKAARTSIKRCAARSTCGKPGFVTCCRSQAGKCLGGFCAKTDPPVACLTNADCPAVSRCSIKRDVEKCTAVAGTAGEFASCCDACG